MQNLEKELKNSYSLARQEDDFVEINLQPTIRWSFFQGHFSGTPVLPGYAIAEISVFFTKVIVKKIPQLTCIHTLRMRKPIQPDEKIKLIIKKNKNFNRFEITWQAEADEKIVLALLDLEVSF